MFDIFAAAEEAAASPAPPSAPPSPLPPPPPSPPPSPQEDEYMTYGKVSFILSFLGRHYMSVFYARLIINIKEE